MPNPGFLVCFLLLFVYVFFYLSYLVFSELPESAVSFLLLIWEKFSAVITLNSSPVYFSLPFFSHLPLRPMLHLLDLSGISQICCSIFSFFFPLVF